MPSAAIQHGQNGLYVFVVDEHSKAPRCARSRSRIRTRSDAVVPKGLNEGDRVVTTGQFLLQPGTPVPIDTAASGS